MYIGNVVYCYLIKLARYVFYFILAPKIVHKKRSMVAWQNKTLIKLDYRAYESNKFIQTINLIIADVYNVLTLKKKIQLQRYRVPLFFYPYNVSTHMHITHVLKSIMKLHSTYQSKIYACVQTNTHVYNYTCVIAKMKKETEKLFSRSLEGFTTIRARFVGRSLTWKNHRSKEYKNTLVEYDCYNISYFKVKDKKKKLPYNARFPCFRQVIP